MGQYRRGCPDETLENALHNAPWHADEWYQREGATWLGDFPGTVFRAVVVEPSANDTENRSEFIDTIADEPVSFNPRERRWGTRGVMHLADDIEASSYR